MTELMPDEMEKLGFTLFKEFARLEYSLKRAGFHGGNGEKATANWDTFAVAIRDKLAADSEIEESRKYMEANPPKQQMVRKGRLVWEPSVADAHPIHNLLLCVRRVRNNLFHGGKFNDGYFEPERSAELLTHSLRILEACLRASSDVRSAYDG